MTIQISITIWTILSFVALAFILDKLLFKPIFEVMDRRKQKIEEDQKLKKTALEDAERCRADALEARAAARREAVSKGEEIAEKARSETADMLAARKAENGAALEEKRKEFTTEGHEIQESLDSALDRLAADYAETLLR